MTGLGCPPARRGTALLEALVALVIVGTAGISLIEAVGGALRLTQLASDREREFMAASQFMESAVLWSRVEIDQRLGERRQGAMQMTIERLSRGTYLLTLRDSTEALLVRTAVYRPEAVDASR